MLKNLFCRAVVMGLLPALGGGARIARSESPADAADLPDQINLVDEGQSPLGVALVRAAFGGDMATVERIVTARPEVVNSQPSMGEKGMVIDYDQWSALHWGVIRNHRVMVAFLLKHGAPPSGKVKTNRLPLEMAGDEAIARLLIDAGANVNAAGRSGAGPLHVAHNAAVARLLIEKGARIDQPTVDFRRETPLLCAASWDSLDVAKVLVEHKANVNAKSSEGKTPLQAACRTGDLALVALLVDHGADVLAADRDGMTPVMCAAAGWGPGKQYAEILRLLVKHGASLTQETKTGETLLHLAAQAHLVEAARYLIDAGFDVNRREKDGLTPLHFAARGGKPSDIDMVKLLLEHHADVNAVAIAQVQSVRRKITPLGYATIVEQFMPVQAEARLYKMAEENVKQVNRTRKVIADLLRRYGAR